MFVLGVGGGASAVHLSGTAAMPIDEALDLAGHTLTDEQREIVVSALRRHGIELVKALRLLSRDTPYASTALDRLRKELR